MFADQFEPDGNNFIYRKHMKGAPIQVSASERAKYIRAFNIYLKYASWGIAIGIITLILFFATYSVMTATDLPDMDLTVGLGLIVVLFIGGHYWAWNLPVRELRGRGTIGEPRSRAEIRRLFLTKLTYGQIAAGAGFGVLMLFHIGSKEGLLSGWNIVWLVLGTTLLIMSAVQAFRKWRFDSAQN